MDDELEHSPRSWLDDFMLWFSWCHLSARASPFLNNYFLPGVSTYYILMFEIESPILFSSDSMTCFACASASRCDQIEWPRFKGLLRISV